DATAITDAMQAWLEAMSKFYTYSPNNQMLIAIFAPHATRVAGYRKWQTFNRTVRRGEKGIPILAPCVYKKDPEDKDSEKVIRFFKVVYIFDISQTDGDPLPPAPEWKSPAKAEKLQILLTNFAASKNITVTVTKDLAAGAQGSSAGGDIKLDPTAGTKTLIHEIAHELLHHGPDRLTLTRETKELEAEAIAYVVALHFGLDDLSSPNYLVLSNADSRTITARANRIRSTAAEIITALDIQ
ncbi:hypothetical protein LCGC14_0761670, partial [marine sediment metagenome]